MSPPLPVLGTSSSGSSGFYWNVPPGLYAEDCLASEALAQSPHAVSSMKPSFTLSWPGPLLPRNANSCLDFSQDKYCHLHIIGYLGSGIDCTMVPGPLPHPTPRSASRDSGSPIGGGSIFSCPFTSGKVMSHALASRTSRSTSAPPLTMGLQRCDTLLLFLRHFCLE